jgi:hypothetical protein
MHGDTYGPSEIGTIVINSIKAKKGKLAISYSVE